MMDFGDHLRTTGSALKNWAIGQFVDSLAVGVLWLAGLYILHVPLAPIWAIIAAVFQIVPQFGPILGLLGPVLAATIKWIDWEHPLGVLVLYAIIAVLDGLVLQPYIMRRTAKVPVWASVLTPIVLGVLWPFWGVLVAPPLLAVLYAYRARRKKIEDGSSVRGAMGPSEGNRRSPQSAEEALARLSPHRTHESNWFKALLCAVGLHRWYSPNVADLVPRQGTRFCRWCSAVRLPPQAGH